MVCDKEGLRDVIAEIENVFIGNALIRLGVKSFQPFFL